MHVYRTLVSVFVMVDRNEGWPLPNNVQSEPRSYMARSVLLGARSVTCMIVGSTALFGVFLFLRELEDSIIRTWLGLGLDWFE
jgi:hypothetical protein